MRLERKGVPLKKFCVVDAWIYMCRKLKRGVLSAQLKNNYIYSDCLLCDAKHDPDSQQTTAMAISPLKNIFYCFACHMGGDGVSLFCHINNSSFAEAYVLMKKRKIPRRVDGRCTKPTCIANPDGEDECFKRLAEAALSIKIQWL